MTMDELYTFFQQPANLLGTTIVAVVVSAAVNYLFRVREARHKLEAEYRYEQRKKFRGIVACYHGRLLSLANSMNYRMWNLYQNHDAGWLDVKGKLANENYYYFSFVFRFLNLFALLREFEREAILIDTRIAQNRDLEILNYVSALRWCMTDASLFDGMPYDVAKPRDHFFSDSLRQVCDTHYNLGRAGPTYEEFVKYALSGGAPDNVFEYFEGLSKDEDRLRWDRLVVFHLLLIGLINTIGQSVHRTGQKKINIVVSQINNTLILQNFVKWLPRHEVPKLYAWRIRWAAWRRGR